MAFFRASASSVADAEPGPVDGAVPSPAECGPTSGAGGTAVSETRCRAVARERRVVVCCGVRGVFAPGGDGVWKLVNGAELRVLEGLGGSADGIGRLRGMGEALAAGVAGPGDLVLLGRCLRSVAESYSAFEADIPDEMVAAITVACSVWDHSQAVEWLCWALTAGLEDNLTNTLGVGAGYQGWDAYDDYEATRGRWDGTGVLDELGLRFWRRVDFHPDPRVEGCAAAGALSAGRALLAWLADGSQPVEVIDAAASHPRTPARALALICEMRNVRLRWRVAQNKRASGRVLHRIASRGHPNGSDWHRRRIEWLVAQNPSAHRRTLRKLSRSDEVAVRSWVCVHPRARRMLRRLAGDDERRVRQCVPLHPRTPRRVLVSLSADRRREVRAAAAANPRLPAKAAKKLTADRSVEARVAVAGRPLLSSVLVERLASDPHWKVRERVAMRDRIDDELLRRLAQDPHRKVRLAAAGNSHCPADALARLASDDNRFVRNFAAGNPSCPMEAISAAAESTAISSRWHTAANPSCPPKALSRLVSDEMAFVRSEAAENPSCPPEALGRLANDEVASVREVAAANPLCPAEALARLASDEDRFVRAAVAANPSTPDEALARLAEDDRFVVFSAARKTLQARRRTRIRQQPGDRAAAPAPEWRAESGCDTEKEQQCHPSQDT